jgi:hypothetical protein
MSDLRAFSVNNDDRATSVDELCTLVEKRARSLGHRLGPWQERVDKVTASRHATCTICGRVVYVRIEGGLLGAAGAAAVEECSTRE